MSAPTACAAKTLLGECTLPTTTRVTYRCAHEHVASADVCVLHAASMGAAYCGTCRAGDVDAHTCAVELISSRLLRELATS